MSCSFSRILAQELQTLEASGVALSPSSPPAVRVVRTTDLPSDSDQIRFSLQARNLSKSLRQYSQDGSRPIRRDADIVTGWNEAGYLRDFGAGLHGEMRFRTTSGAVVCINADPESGNSAQPLRIQVSKDGAEYCYGLEDIVARLPRDTGGASPLLALPG